jgi:hypothetical protein
MVDFYSRVPKDLRANMLYRIKVRDLAQRDPSVRQALMEACKADVLYWMNVFGWVYEPRPRIINGVEQPPVVPFITWSHQDPIIRTLRKHLGFDDIGLEKSRGEGVSWILILLALHDWLFFDMKSVGLVSKNEKSADNPDDPKSLFWKIDWELTKLPVWMVGEKDKDWTRNRQDHTLRHLRTQGTVTAFAATSDLNRGGRNTWFGWDEAASFPFHAAYDAQKALQPATDSRLYVSSPQGPTGVFADVMHQASNMVKLRMHWSDNQTKNRGLYRLEKDQAVAVDPSHNPLPQDYTEATREVWVGCGRTDSCWKASCDHRGTIASAIGLARPHR